MKKQKPNKRSKKNKSDHIISDDLFEKNLQRNIRLVIELAKVYGISGLTDPEKAEEFVRQTREPTCQAVKAIEPIDQKIEALYSERQKIEEKTKSIQMKIDHLEKELKNINDSEDIESALKRAREVIDSIKTRH